MSGAGAVRQVAEMVAAWMRRAVGDGAPLAALLAWHALPSRGLGRGPRRGVPGCAPPARGARPSGHAGGEVEGAIAITTASIAALAYGAGTCWAGLVPMAAAESPELSAALAVSAGQRCCAAMVAGRPAVEPLRVPHRRPPRIEWR